MVNQIGNGLPWSTMVWTMTIIDHELMWQTIKNMRKPQMWILTRSDTNQAVQLVEMARGWKFCIEEVEALYYPSSENKGALISFAVLFSHMQNVDFLMTWLISFGLLCSIRDSSTTKIIQMMLAYYLYMRCAMRKPVFCVSENKRCRSAVQLISASSWIKQSLYFFNLKIQACIISVIIQPSLCQTSWSEALFEILFFLILTIIYIVPVRWQKTK